MPKIADNAEFVSVYQVERECSYDSGSPLVIISRVALVRPKTVLIFRDEAIFSVEDSYNDYAVHHKRIKTAGPNTENEGHRHIEGSRFENPWFFSYIEAVAHHLDQCERQEARDSKALVKSHGELVEATVFFQREVGYDSILREREQANK